MRINSTRLGEVEVQPEDIIRFEHGLPGFPGEKEFAYLPYESDSPFVFLQSVKEVNLTFLLVEPFAFFKDYTFTLNDQFVQELGFTEDNPPLITNIVTIRDSLGDATANLLAPVIINKRAHLAAQIVLEKTEYTTRHRLFPQGLPQLAREGGK
jgi:flagellar assembly factor FliW